MRRTRPSPLIGLGVLGLALGFLLELAIVQLFSAPMLIPPITLTVTLIVIGVIVVILAIPIRRAVHGKTRIHIDPFRAMRIAVLAKACSLVGALLTGAGIGFTVYVLTRTVLVASASVWTAVLAAVGAIILLVCGLVAEFFCTLPPPTDEEPGSPDHIAVH